MEHFIEEKLHLEFNQKTQISPIKNGVDYLGFHFYLSDTGKVIRKLKQQTKYKYKRKLKSMQKKYASGEKSLEDINRVISSYHAHPKWGNTKMYEAKLVVPAGEKIHIGIVAPVTLPTGTVLPGGADQILLKVNWPKEWIQGYRRVTARQLQSYPIYSDEEPQEISVGKKNLYPSCCPRCGGIDVKKLTEAEQFDFVGSKGRTYTMHYHCQNSKCQYYW